MFSSVGFQHMRGFRGPRVQINHQSSRDGGTAEQVR